MSWLTGELGFRWPWLAVALTVLVQVLLLFWTRVWRRRRAPSDPILVAHAERLLALPRYRALVRRRTLLGGAATVAALVTCAGAILLAGRLQEIRVDERDDRSRDIMLCLDASGSMLRVDAQVVSEFRKVVAGLRGERIGLSIWSGSTVTVFPLTDDYDFAMAQLEAAAQGIGRANFPYLGGTVLRGQRQSSQIGDAVVSCTKRFDHRDEERSRTIVLASDNDPLGEGVYTFAEGIDYAVEHDVVVHGIAAPHTVRDLEANAEYESLVTSTGGSYWLLGSAGSPAEVVRQIEKEDARRIDQPPLITVSDRPRTGTVVAGIGLAGLLLVWLVQAVPAVRNRRGGTG